MELISAKGIQDQTCRCRGSEFKGSFYELPEAVAFVKNKIGSGEFRSDVSEEQARSAFISRVKDLAGGTADDIFACVDGNRYFEEYKVSSVTATIRGQEVAIDPSRLHAWLTTQAEVSAGQYIEIEWPSTRVGVVSQARQLLDAERKYEQRKEEQAEQREAQWKIYSACVNAYWGQNQCTWACHLRLQACGGRCAPAKFKYGGDQDACEKDCAAASSECDFRCPHSEGFHCKTPSQ